MLSFATLLRSAIVPTVTLWCLALSAGCWGTEIVFSSVGPEITLAPQSLFVGNIWIGDTQTRMVTLSNAGNIAAGNVDVSLQESDGPAVASVRLPESQSLGPAADLQLEIRVTGLGPGAGLFTAEVQINVDGQTFTLPIQASITAAPSCENDNPCQVSTFDFATGSCRIDIRADGTSCDDNNVCTLATQCSAGQCVGTMLDCDDGIACTADVCDPTLGCQPEPVNARCDDEDPCSDDVCAADLGCQNTTADDGTLCFQDGCASIGLCLSGNCLVSEATEGFPCDDGDSCTFAETCVAGECSGGEQGVVAVSEPRSVLEGTMGIDLCLGSFDGCSAAAVGSFEEILAVYENQGSSFIVWRSDYFSTLGGTCMPLSERVANDPALRNFDLAAPAPGAPVPPSDSHGWETEPVGDDDNQPPPDVPEFEACAAGVFLTVLPPGFEDNPADANAPWTLQLAATRGPAAAAFAFSHAESLLRVGVVISLGIDLRVIEKDFAFADQLADVGSYSYGLGRTSDLNIPARRLAMAYDNEGITTTVAAAGAVRQGSLCSGICDDDDTACCLSAVEVFQKSSSSAPSTSWLNVPEIYDESCPAWSATGYSWDVRDLEVKATGNTSVSFLTEKYACGDIVGGPDRPLTPMLFAEVFEGGWSSQSPAVFAESQSAGEGVLRLKTTANGELVAAAMECDEFVDPGPDAPDGEGPTCLPVVRSSWTAPVVPVQEWGDLAPFASRYDILPLYFSAQNAAGQDFTGQDFLLTRSDDLLGLRYLDDGVITNRAVLGFADDTRWRATANMHATGDLLVGIADLTTVFTEEDGFDEVLALPRLAIQRFGCAAP